MNEDELQKKREEAERKARRGEIDPTHEFTFLLIGQVRTIYSLDRLELLTHWTGQKYLLIGQVRTIYSLDRLEILTHWTGQNYLLIGQVRTTYSLDS